MKCQLFLCVKRALIQKVKSLFLLPFPYFPLAFDQISKMTAPWVSQLLFLGREFTVVKNMSYQVIEGIDTKLQSSVAPFLLLRQLLFKRIMNFNCMHHVLFWFLESLSSRRCPWPVPSTLDCLYFFKPHYFMTTAIDLERGFLCITINFNTLLLYLKKKLNLLNRYI